jgi:phage terminase large subunit-like protein
VKDYCAIGIEYAEHVVSGEIDVCKLVKQACQRQLGDLGRAAEGPWVFDVERGNKICRFIEKLPHIKGRWRSRYIELEPWQCFLLTTLFGWVDAEGFRRFRKAYVEVPRKNSKSTLAAGIALYMLCADGEPGCEAYSAAVTRDQARVVWETAQQMVKVEREMQSYFGVEALAHSITVANTSSYFQPLSRDADSLEGKNPHIAIVDELHAHKTREVFDVLNLAMGSRRQSLLFAITTAGSDKMGVCYEQHEYVEQVLNGRHIDDRYFGLIYTLDPSDNWTSEASARKANPNYGVSVMPDDMTTLCQQAQRSAESQNAFMNKRLNLWTSVGTAYFNMLAWQNLCRNEELKLEDFSGKRCIVALDLASKDDIAVSLKLFHENNKRYVFTKYYLPSSAIERGNNPNYGCVRRLGAEVSAQVCSDRRKRN